MLYICKSVIFIFVESQLCLLSKQVLPFGDILSFPRNMGIFEAFRFIAIFNLGQNRCHMQVFPWYTASLPDRSQNPHIDPVWLLKRPYVEKIRTFLGWGQMRHVVFDFDRLFHSPPPPRPLGVNFITCWICKSKGGVGSQQFIGNWPVISVWKVLLTFYLTASCHFRSLSNREIKSGRE